MAKSGTIKVWRVVICCLLVAVFIPIGSWASESTFRLTNGMEVILKENHSSPMISNIVFVKSGSKYESRYENGITHFLEHLSFDGTASKGREELDRSIRDLGGYINAFTRKDLTAFLVLLPRQYIEYGMTVQADMLFNLTFPEEELPKERKVVIEEINRSADSPGAAAEEFFTQKAYVGTTYGRPVLGYKPFIENIPREAIIAYWKQYYTPDNMVMLVIGDFETEAMTATIEKIFGGIEPASEQRTDKWSEEDPLVGRHRSDTVANIKSTYITFSISAPHFSSPDYLPFDLLISYLSLDGVSPLKTALKSGAQPLATEVGVSLETLEEFSRLELSIITDNPEYSDTIIDLTLQQLAALSQHQVDPDVIQGIKTSARCDAIYYAEKLHYYAFMIAPLMMTAGWDFIQQYPDMLDTVQWQHSQSAAGEWLTDPSYVVTVVSPADSSETPYKPAGITEAEVVAHFDSTSFPTHELVEGHAMEYPGVGAVDFDMVDNSIYHREVLDNGLTVIVKSNQDSRVFAVNAIGKNRSINEPDGKAGITDFVNRCLEKGTAGRDAGRLAGDLAAIGANLTLYDNPWIPYDDRYTTRDFSFFKFETIDRFAETGMELCADILLNPSFDSADVEETRREMLGVLGRGSSSPGKVARNLFYETLFSGEAFARPIMGTARSIDTITTEDLREHHRRFYSPENVILSIVSSHDIPQVMLWVRKEFGSAAPSTSEWSEAASVPMESASGEAHHELDKEQISIYAGGMLPGATSDDAVDLSIASSVLSSRLYLNLREKQGLAYSTGVGTRLSQDRGWYYLVIGTSSENYDKAYKGLMAQTEELISGGPTQDEVKTAKNQIWGRLMSAKLSRINQAYYLGVGEFLGRGLRYDLKLLEQLGNVNTETVQQTAAKYFVPKSWIIATAGHKD